MASVDIALLGATGFTGALTADYLSTHLPDGATWAVAGRNQAKLEAVADHVEAQGGVRPEIISADTGNADSMAALARSTRVLVTTVGPYVQLGEPAVKAAAEAGIAYVDLTGEPEFVDQMWLKYHAVAEQTGAKLVHACGFDSIPYDLGVLFTVEQMPEDVPIDVKGYIRAGGTASGGTFHSAVGAFSRLREARKAAAERKRLEPRPEGRRIRGGGSLGRGAAGKGWAMPLPTIDPQVVLRSARSLDRYGPEFTYSHFAQFKKLPMMAATLAGGAVVLAAAQLGPTRSALLKLKAQGDGPDEAKRASSWFNLRLIAQGGGRTVTTEVSGGDPGYTETAKMLSESALCLAFDDVPKVSGQTTTAVAMGDALIERLQAAGITFRTL
ncbi:saccharopine dehydrogenase family protein [Aeromicrobium wangtongii]|uniref:Saccharopine dehydrogenase NADP-binding domain-containing protein n=1 Tax=Aeromicrobium wangtongii TaxID=2969247 RepID=A0ABY5MCN8_9ACTN|nr:saccharopine dehydrogenase NADP-binding domain-containing protein [Aeromicrobium wangtongii]MCD9197260.1 saccharopine dehydrogenase NADP-binding domain-containing protein [Aeromicrobium wangtongii]UUP14755.1 saccharopine dehydrogenase NADP-binding domain-containing protein [Aeromicrobium wangtongii]